MSSPPIPDNAASRPASLGHTLLLAAVLSIVAGIVLQVVLMIAAAKMPNSVVAETAGRVSWSTVVCCALALGNGARKSLPAVMGLLGAVSAPAALHAARVVQRAISQGGSAAPGLPSSLELALAKATEYALFGFLIGWLATGRGAKRHAIIGLCIGAAFALYLVSRLLTNAQPPTTNAQTPIARPTMIPPGSTGNTMPSRPMTMTSPTRNSPQNGIGT